VGPNFIEAAWWGLSLIVGVTGVSGGVGRKLASSLLEWSRCSRVVGVDLRKPEFRSDRLKFYRMDVREKRLAEVFEREEVDAVVHTAFASRAESRSAMRDMNVNGARNVLEACREADVSWVMVLSSAMAYGAYRDNPVPLTEEHPLRGGRLPYSQDKREIDLLAQEFARENPDVRVLIARPAMVLGPNVESFLSRYIMGSGVALIPWDANAPLQFIHEDDVVRFCKLAMEQRASGAYNIAGEGALTFLEVLEISGRRYLKLPPVVAYAIAYILHKAGVMEASPAQYDVVRFPQAVSTEKARRELGFNPEYTTLGALISFLRSKGVKPKLEE